MAATKMSSFDRTARGQPWRQSRGFPRENVGNLVRHGRQTRPGVSLAFRVVANEISLLNASGRSLLTTNEGPLLMSPRLSRLCAVWYIVLIALPFTAPSQTIDLVDLLSGNASLHGVQFAPTPALASLLADTDLSLIPALETTAAQLKFGSRSAPEGLNFATASTLAASGATILATPVSSTAAPGIHPAFPTVLRR
jgi:hypothetical protein